jgi:hypothetical protein
MLKNLKARAAAGFDPPEAVASEIRHREYY